ncbi:hypothetical protein DRN58_06360, partial [Thermococci archaeon]
DTSELFDEIEKYLTSEEYLKTRRFNKVQFAKDFEKRKLKEEKGVKNNQKSLEYTIIVNILM